MCHCNKWMVQSLQWSNSLICINCQHFLQQINIFPSVSLLCQHVSPFQVRRHIHLENKMRVVHTNIKLIVT